MAQIYLLSVLTLLLGGALAAADRIASRFVALAPVADLAEQRSVAVGVGIAAIAVGALKLFVRAPFDTLPVAGDLLPALAGIAVGVVLVARERVATDEETETPPNPIGVLLQYRALIGYAGLLVGLLHFLLPAAVLL